jgi:hypothetical protein
MGQTTRFELRLRELIDAELPAHELERLARVDALLRVVAVHDRDEAANLPPRAGHRYGAPRTGRHARERAHRLRAKCQAGAGKRPASADAESVGARNRWPSHRPRLTRDVPFS